MGMIVAAHQPHFLPWLGYLHKVGRADLFVVMDDLQFEAQNFQNRNRVKVNNGTTWLTVPLERGPQESRICDKRIARPSSPKEDWRRKSLLSLKTHYGKAPYWRDYALELESTFLGEHASLLELDLHLLRLFMRWFGITTPLVLASTLALEGQKTARIVQMCQRVGATTYLSGAGGSKDYLELGLFDAAKIFVRFQDFEHPEYPQRYPALGFIKNLAALDLLLNCGLDSPRILFGSDTTRGLPHTPLEGGPLGKPIL
jgi:WbqC-like protein family